MKKTYITGLFFLPSVSSLLLTTFIATNLQAANGDRYADVVVSYNQGPEVSEFYGRSQYILGRTPKAGVSLGINGSITVKFTDNEVKLSGDESEDLVIYEIGDRSEPSVVTVSGPGGTVTFPPNNGGVSIYDLDKPEYGFEPGAIFDTVKIEHQGTPLTRQPYAGPDIAIVASGAINKKDDCYISNPCSPATGNKFQPEEDYTSATPELSFKRYYNSDVKEDVGLGRGWTSSVVGKKQEIINDQYLIFTFDNGEQERWVKKNNQWKGDADSEISVTSLSSGFTVSYNKKYLIETYDSNGKLLSKKNSKGITTYTYEKDPVTDARSIVVTDRYGKKVTYNLSPEKRLLSLHLPNNEVYRYNYDTNDNLLSVSYPDLTPDDNTDNPQRLYHYEDSRFPHHLTGITDENGRRYATYAYDANGKAISSEHAQTTNGVGQERIELNYQN